MRLGRTGVGLFGVLLLLAVVAPAHASPQWLPSDTLAGPNPVFCVLPPCPPGPAISSGLPKVVMDSAGNATVAFGTWDSGSGSNKLWTETRPAGGAWGSATLVDSGANTAQLAGNAQGDAVLGWMHNATSVIQAELRTAGGAFGSPQTVSVGPVGYGPAAAINP